MKLLLVEDDQELAESLLRQFLQEGIEVDHQHDGEAGLQAALHGSHQVIVLDRMLPKLDGLAFVKILRRRFMAAPVIYLTTMSGIDDRVQGLDAGADDYLVKPFAFAELLARVRVLARRTSSTQPVTRLHAGSLEMDLLQREVLRDGRKIELLPQEFRLLEYLVRHQNRIVTRMMLLENVWNIHFDPQTSMVESHISRLRAKLNADGGPDLILTVRGMGYKLLATD